MIRISLVQALLSLGFLLLYGLMAVVSDPSSARTLNATLGDMNFWLAISGALALVLTVRLVRRSKY